MSLQNLTIELEYRSNRNNVIADFYIPALSQATEYNRAVGFFSSTALIEISKGLSKLVENNGMINLIASPKLSEDDIKAIEYGYQERERIVSNALLRSFTEPEDVFQKKRLNLLAYLVAAKKLNIKIAYMNNQNNLGIFHDKLGIIIDQCENAIAFSGSMNETAAAFSYNYEAIDVFCNWKSEESNLRVNHKIEVFNRIWNDKENGIEVLEFPQVVREKLDSYNIGPIDGNIDQEEILGHEKLNTPTIPDFVHLYDYQLEAIAQWKLNNYFGIYDMATGTGKTYTGLSSIITLLNDLKGRLAIIIVCPYLHLVEQWVEDLNVFNIPHIVGHSGYKKYKQLLKGKIFDYNLGINNVLCFICTNDTFATPNVQELIHTINGDVLLMADEAHNLGASKINKCLTNKYNYRLALSATIDRFGDPEGTKILYDYFGEKCIEYTLARAIEENKLTPYKYYPKIVYLSEDEFDQYRCITSELIKCLTVDKRGKKKLNEKGKKLAIKRARVIAGAINKIDVLRDIMKNYQTDNHLLIYCGATRLFETEEDFVGKRQIELVTELLGEELNMRVSRFTSEEDMQTRAILKDDFEDGQELQALIAIKCLDEGVNIPSIKTAFILASTTNPKEYIQRRGRVLRKNQGKEFAEIYDFVTLPRPLDLVSDLPLEEKKRDLSLIRNELRRVREFGKDSLIPIEVDNLIELIEENYGFLIASYSIGDELDD